MSNTVMGCMWYIDNDASFHMMGNIDLFGGLEKKDLKKNIDFGDDRRYNTTNIGTFTIQRESGSPLRLADVLKVPDLRNNLVTVAILEDYGYDVMFRKGKFFLKHIATGQVKQIVVRVKNLYAFEVEDA